MDIHALLDGIAAGDMDALGALYDALAPRLFHYIRTITPDMAEDVTHDVFLQVNKQAARLAKMANPTAYIFVTARNHAYNQRKRGSRTVPLDGAPEAGNPSPCDRLFFEDAFSRLPANRREAVYLHLICGYTHKEIAHMQNAPLVTVKWRYGKAITQLKAYFTEQEDHCHEPL